MSNYFDTSNAKPLNNVYDVPRSQYKNLYGIPSESPVVEQGDEMPDLSQYSLANWLKNNHFDAVDQGRKANLVKRYRNEIVPMIAHYVGEDAEAAKVNFDNQLPEEIKQATRPINRNAWGWINDNVNTAGNAIFGLGKSVSDLINPDSSVSQWLDDRIQDGLGMSSDYMKDQRLKTELDVSEAKKNGDWGVGASLGFYWRNPAQLVAEVAGNLGPFGVVGKGAKTIGLGTKTTQGTMAGLGAAMGAGEVRGNIYEHMMKMPEDRLLTDSPQYKALLTYGVSPEEARKEVATAVSKHLGEIGVGGAVGLASGLVGVEKILSGAVSQKGIGTVAKTALGEGVSEAIEEGTIATASNYAIRKNDTQQNLFDNVAINAAKGAVLGAFSGGGVAAINSFTGDDSASEIVENMSSQTVGDNALKVNAPTLPNQLNTSNGETNPNSPVVPDTITDANVDSVLKGLAQKYGQGDEGRTTAIYNELIRSHQAGLLPKLAESGSVANNAAAEFLEIVSGERSLTHGQSPDQVVEETTPIPTVAEQNAMANNPVPEQMANLVPEQSVGGTQAIPPIIPAQDNPISPTVENTPPIPDSTKAEENTEPSSDDEGFALEQKNSRSAIKSVQANIKRGRDAMNTAIAERRTVHRAMFNHELNGWVDFEWGDTGRMLPNGKTKGAMGISHIIDKRMRVDGMSEQEVSRFLVEDVIETIAKGKISREKVLDKTRAVEIVYSGNEVRVTKKEGNNAWIVTGFKQFQPVNQSRGATTSDLRINSPIRSRTEMGAVGKVKTDTHPAGSVDTEKVTHSKPTLTRQGMGASDANNVLQSKPEVKQTPMSEAMAQHVQAIEKAVLKAIGRGNKRHVRIDTRANLERPDDVQSLNLDGVEGWFDPRTGQIMLVADNLTPETAAFVAWHELGHRGIASRAFREFKGLLNSIRNPYINQLADLIMGERQKANENGANDRAGTNRLVAIEEAVVELLAAKNTGNWQHLENKYGLQVPTTFKQNTPSALTLIMRRMKEIIASIFGRQSQDMGDKEVIRLLQLVNQAIELDAQVGGEGDIRYSLNESSDSAFAKAVDAVANGEVVEKQIIDVGTTPDVLKMLGLPDTNVTISSAVLKKVMFGKHNVTANSLKKLPSQINSPVAVMQSSTQENGYVVLTELTEYVDDINKPVIAALHLKKSRDGLALINIASVYGRNISQIQRGLENDLLYWNKEKGAKFLDNLTLQLRSPLSENSSEKGSQFLTAFGLQLPSHMQSNTNLSDNNIKTEKDLLQYQEGKTAEKVAYEQAKKEGKTELTFKQWEQVRSPEFKRWFGDWENDSKNASKVINPKTGEPLVVYHGSKRGEDFNVFNPKLIGERFGLGTHGKGFYFSNSLGTAIYYGERPLKEVFLNIRNPFKREGDISEVNNRFTSSIKRKGHDGVFGKDTLPWANKNDMEFVVFTSNQIKSATDNNGNFDLNNDDIRFSRQTKIKKSDILINEKYQMGDTYLSINGNNTLGDILVDTPLFKRYPNLADIKVEKEKSSSTVEYNDANNTITVGSFIKQTDFKSVVVKVLQQKINENPVVNETKKNLNKETYEQDKANGLTNLSYEEYLQTRSDAFKAFFGDWENNVRNVSKVVDENTNEPLVLYHGSGSIFNVYDPNKMATNGLQYGAGFYFTDSENLATAYSKEGGEVQKVYLNIRKWLSTKKISITDKQIREILSEIDNINEDITEDGVLSNFTDVRQDGISQATSIALKTLRENKNDIDLIDELTSLGGKEAATKAVYNVLGAVGNKVMLPGGDMVYIVLASNQIKSATRNNGEFDAKNEDIRFSRVVNRSKKESLEKLRQSESINISGKEIEASEDLRQYKRNALEYGKSLRGTYVNKDSGRRIELGASGVKEVLQHDYKNPEHLQSVAAIPQIIENAIYIDTLQNEDLEKNPSIQEYEYYVAGLNIGGRDYTVKAVVAISENGERYYDHKLSEINKDELLSYSHRITNPGTGKTNSSLKESDLLEARHADNKSGVPQQQSTLEKGELLSLIDRLSNAGSSENKSPLSNFDDKRLLQILQDNSASDGNIRFSRQKMTASNAEVSPLEDITDKFNQELAEFVNGQLTGSHIFNLGKPSELLKSVGFPDLPIELKASKLSEKANTDWHKFDIADVKGLPNALQNPLAVFSYGDKTKSHNVITQLEIGGKQLLVGVHFNQNRNGLSVNSIRGLFPKDNAEWLNWIGQKDKNGDDKHLYLDKQKIQTLINQQRTNLADVGYLDLDLIESLIQKLDGVNDDENQQKTTAKFSRKREIEEDAKVKIQDLVSRVRQDKTLKRIDEFARKAEVLQGEPVYTITERKAPKENSALRQWAIDLFNRAGGKAVNPEIGEVTLNERSVKNSMAHGMNPLKASAFESISKVIEQGVVIAQAEHGETTSYFISAPVRIENVDTLVNVLVHKDVNKQSMYLHSVQTKENLLDLTKNESVADIEISKPHGKLSPRDIASILQKHLVFNLDENSGKKFSRKREIEEDAKVKIQDLVSRVRQDKTLKRIDEFARKAEVLQGEPVYTITERKAPKENSALRQWAIDLFNRAGGKAVNPEIGEVILNARSVKDDLAHGISPDKATAFEAVVDVIEKGVVVATANHERLTSSFISAPVEIEGKVNIVTALVRKDANSQRFYLHSVIPKEKLLKEALTGLYGDSVADVKTSEPHGKLRSGDIASILQKHLVFNLDENSGKKFSRKREIEEDAKVKIQDLVSRVRQDKTLNEQVDLMPVPEVAVKEAEKYGLNIKGFTRLIDSSAINHILNKHGNEKKEVARGQLPIRDKDFVDIIEVYNNPDKVVYGGKTRIGRDAIFYLKKNNDDSIVVVEESRTKRRKLALTSMRKYPSTVHATSILKSLNLNAQSDFDGNGIIVEDNPAPRNSSEPKFSRKPTQANVSPVRQASTFEEARKEAKDFQGKVLTNNDSNITAVVSRNSLDKMLSGKAVNKSVSPKIHALAVANIDKLYENAIYGWSKEDRNKDTNINAIHRFFAVLNTDEGQRLVKLTVKETAQTDRNNRLYTLEAVSLNEETPAAQWVGEMLQQDNVEPRTIRSARDIDNLAQSVEKNNSNLKFSRKPTSILPEVKEPESIKSIASSFSVKDATKVVKSFVTGGGRGVQPKWLEDLTTLVFDGKNPLSNVIRRFGTPEARDLELTMRTYQAMTAKVTQDFEEGMYAPMIETLSQAWNKTFKKHYKEMGAAGWKQFLEDIGTTQNLVLHGRERNAEIRRKTQGKDEAGSGRTDAEIEEIEKVLNQQVPGLIDFTKQVYKNHLKPMLDYRDKLLRESGLLTQEMEDARPQYEWYVPLFGDPNEDGAMDNGFVHQAVGELRDIKDKQAKGRAGTLADNPLENVLTATQTAIYRAGQQVFLEKLFDFLEKNPSARRVMGAKINTSQTKEIFTKYVDKDGFVKERLKPNASMDKDAIVFRNGDKVSVVKIGNRNILNALKGLNKAHIEGVLRLISRPTRFLSKVYTRYNPMFPLMNKLRDSQAQMVFVLSDAPVKHKARAAFKATRYNAAFTLQWRQNPNSDYHQWREEYEHLGGTSPYIDLFRDDVMANLSEDFAQAVGVDTKAKIKKMGNAVAKVIDGINEHFEMTSRIATYKALVEEGMSKKEAVLYVKNLMNFETKGKYGQELGAFYAFANAALFDARRTMQALRTPRGAAVFAVSFAIQYAIYGALKALGGDDEDGIARLNKVPLSSAGRWWLLIDSNDPEGKGLKFPVGFGMGGRIPLTIAAALHRWHDGVDDLGTFTSNVMKEGLAANFSPLEPIDIDPTKDLFGYLMQQFSPTSVRPIVQLASNKTGQGAPIHKLDTWVGQGLKFDNALPATNRLFSNIAKWVYDETGVDSYPETWRFLFQSYLGTGSMELLRSWMLADEKAGTQWTLSDIPLAQAFAHKGDKYDVMVYREMENEVQRLMNERDYAYEQGRGFEFDQEHPGLVQVSVYIKEASKQLKKLNRTKKAYELIEDPRERQEKVKAITQEMRHIQMFVNKEVKVMLENE